MRLVFMGTPLFSVPTLRALHAAGHEIAGVYTRAPAASGRRGKALVPSPVHAAAEELGLTVRTPRTLKDEEEIEAFRALEAEAAVVVAYGRILPRAVLDAVLRGCWNAHASLLPRWRGAAPIQRAIMAGDRETGVQVMRMEEGLDTGPIALTHREPIGPTTTAGDLFDTLADRGAELMVEAMARLERGTLDAVPQGENGVTYADKITKDEARIDWTRSAGEIARHVNGLSPFPGAWTTHEGERVKLLRATTMRFKLASTDSNAAPVPGTVGPGLAIEGRAPVLGTVAAGESVPFARYEVVVLEAQKAGGRGMTREGFAQAFPPGSRFE